MGHHTTWDTYRVSQSHELMVPFLFDILGDLYVIKDRATWKAIEVPESISSVQQCRSGPFNFMRGSCT